MIKIENVGTQYRRTYTDDESKQLLKVGTSEIYDEAIDVIEADYVYIEVDRKEEYLDE